MPRQWRSSLADAETRLIRSLGIAAGPVGLELTDPTTLQPVVIADDATRPGASAYRGKRWSQVWNFSGVAGTVNSGTLIATVPFGLVIRRVYIRPDAGGRISMYVGARGVTPPAYTFTPQSPFVENNTGATDLAPITAGASNAVGPVAGYTIVWAMGSPADELTVVLADWHIPPGGAFCVAMDSGFTGDYGVVVQGEVF